MASLSIEYNASLTQAGLTKDQSLVYEALVKNGTMPASRIPRLVPISRPLAYKVLGELLALGLVEKREETGKVALFSPEHPLKLKELIEKRRTSVDDAKIALDGVLGKLLSDFNLTSGKPGVQFFEGVDGFRQILDDILTSKTEVYSYVDITETMDGELAEISKAFGIQRKRYNIKKKNLSVDTPEGRSLVSDGYLNELTEERLIPWPTPLFGTTIQIYDNKVSFRTSAKPSIGIIINDPHIYTIHKQLFELLWDNPLTYKPPSKNSP